MEKELTKAAVIALLERAAWQCRAVKDLKKTKTDRKICEEKALMCESLIDNINAIWHE